MLLAGWLVSLLVGCLADVYDGWYVGWVGDLLDGWLVDSLVR